MPRLFTSLVGVLLVASSACSDDAVSGGPIDGAWRATTATCGGQAQAIPVLTVTIDDKSGTFVTELPGTCTSTVAESYVYPTPSSIAITPKSNDCKPSPAACAPAFGGSLDCPNPPPTTLDFVRNGDQLTVSRKSLGPPADGCPAGQLVEINLKRL